MNAVYLRLIVIATFVAAFSTLLLSEKIVGLYKKFPGPQYPKEIRFLIFDIIARLVIYVITLTIMFLCFQFYRQIS